MNSRRNFFKSLGAAVAITMLPFVRPIKLSAPKKAKVVFTQMYCWVFTPEVHNLFEEKVRQAIVLKYEL